MLHRRKVKVPDGKHEHLAKSCRGFLVSKHREGMLPPFSWSRESTHPKVSTFWHPLNESLLNQINRRCTWVTSEAQSSGILYVGPSSQLVLKRSGAVDTGDHLAVSFSWCCLPVSILTDVSKRTYRSHTDQAQSCRRLGNAVWDAPDSLG